jgi:phosphoribosylaminoimidazolecarboxamide formyltransferase/IMP cyclohydrolase
VRALLSVANRDGIVELVRELGALGVELYATEATLAALGDLDAKIQPHVAADADPGGGLAPYELVVANVEPFASQIGARSVGLDEALGLIDVAGASLISAAARSHASIAVVSAPRQYHLVLADLRAHGAVSANLRQQLAAEALSDVAGYYSEVAGYLNHVAGQRLPARLVVAVEKVRDLPYGENPHQQAAFYRETAPIGGSLADAWQYQGDEPTFNDLIDLDAAYRIATDFTAPTCCIVKRANPTGLASNDRLADAYQKALDGDPVSAFGAVVALNREVDGETAAGIAGNAYEAIVAPAYSAPAREILAEKQHLALLAVPLRTSERSAGYGIGRLDFHRIDGGLLVETRDRSELDRSQLKVVTRRRPTLEELTDLLFAWRAVRHVTSNAVVLAHNTALVGVGAGQASRLTAVEIALHKAADRAAMSVLASDAYFPFADAIQLAAERGVTAIIQPGGSARDEMAIEVADRHHMAMVFTGRRHYRH